MRRVVAGLLRRATAAWALVLVLAAGAAVAQPTAGEPVGPTEAAAPTATGARARLSAIERRFETWDRTAVAIAQQLDLPAPESEALALTREALVRQRAEASALARDLAARLAPLEAEAAAFGPRPTDGDDEAPAMRARRADVEGRLGSARADVRQAEAAVARADALIARIAEVQRRLFARQLLARGPTVLDGAAWASAGRSAGQLLERMIDGVGGAIVGFQPFGRHFPLLAALVVLGAAIGFYRGAWVRRIDGLIAAITATPSDSMRVGLGAAVTALRVAPPAIGALGLAFVIDESALLSALGETIVWRAAEGVAIAVAAVAVVRVLLAPRAAAARIVDVGDACAHRATREATRLAAVLVAGRTLFAALDGAGATPALLAFASLALAMVEGPLLFRMVTAVLDGAAQRRRAALTAALAAHPEDHSEPKEEVDADVGLGAMKAARWAGVLVAAAIPVAALAGYDALARHLAVSAGLTLALVAAYTVLLVVAQRLLSAWRGAPSRGGAFAGVLIATGLALVAAPLLALAWGAALADVRAIGLSLLEGVDLGGLRVSLGGVVGAVILALIGLWLTRFAQRVLRRAVLPKTTLEPGVQSSLTAGVGYVGAIVTLVAAISIAGVDLSNLAIVAGALSVGIGFGLQTIVNNFVSGVILLVERPVKVGDWIEVGGAQGYVRKINVRSTEIETFDRSSVIVPNSELISNKLTNWTHKNLHGRVICKVGVSYAADPELVMRILDEIGRAHPQVLKYPKPFVYFVGFGESSLDFELRVIVRDVNWMLGVHGDLNLAILKRFREAGVEIPFPQRDLHLRSGAEALEALGEIKAAASKRRRRAVTADVDVGGAADA